MANEEQRKEALIQVKAKIQSLAKVNASKPARTEELSPSINFQDAVNPLRDMLEFCKQLKERDLALSFPRSSVGMHT